MVKVVLDTNVLLVSIGTNSKYRPILNAILSGKIATLISTDIYLEYLEKIEEKANIIVAQNIVNALLELPYTTLVTVNYKWNIIKEDSDDNKFVDCAVAGNANYLVSNDKHFNILKTINFPSVELINATSFLEMLHEF